MAYFYTMVQKVPILAHFLVETAAAASFIGAPQKQLPDAKEDAVLILRSYGGLLLSVNFMCLFFLFRPDFDDTTRMFATCLASYHLWPISRAWTRLSSRVGLDGEQGRVLQGPRVHLVVHAGLFVGLLGVACL
jgi:hypothetical protein